jgi:hypothetical protein
MSRHDYPPQQGRPRRPYLYEIEFALGSSSRREEVFAQGPGSRCDLLDDQLSNSIRARLLDPRLQRIVAAAANGWVVERFPQPTVPDSKG